MPCKLFVIRPCHPAHELQNVEVNIDLHQQARPSTKILVFGLVPAFWSTSFLFEHLSVLDCMREQIVNPLLLLQILISLDCL